jgi:hypothetical protein
LFYNMILVRNKKVRKNLNWMEQVSSLFMQTVLTYSDKI